MVNRFIEHIRIKNLLDKDSRYLIGISGGLDSVALGCLLLHSGYRFEVAHVNFGLRGDESDGDEDFVKSLADKWGVPFHSKRVPSLAFEEKGASTQMVAREVRYRWFFELVEKKSLQGVLVAHHFEDQVETVLLNLLRGTGIEGIYGMSEKKGNVIRPLLPFKKIELEMYLKENNWDWREDSSNKKSEYKRNFIRNEVLPVISEKFPNGLLLMDQSFSRIKDTGRAFFHLYQKWKDEFIQKKEGCEMLNVSDFNHLPGKNSLLYYWLRDFGFRFSDIEDMVTCIESGSTGKIFYSGEYMVNLDRDYLIIGKKNVDWESFLVSKDDIRIKIKEQIYDMLLVDNSFPLDRNPQNAMLDLGKLTFPLTVRKWEAGDRMVPLGMKNEKKISDLLVDLKVPLIEKQNVAVLVDKDEIVWMVGHRISDRYKCDASTENILYLKKIMS